jgi:glycerol-3-phosphate dehydrogenase (NAD(P)+)
VKSRQAVATIGVIGAGSWGTALAKMLAESGHDVTLWAHNPQVGRIIAETRENTPYLPGFELPASLRPTSDLREAAAGKEVVLSVSPSHVVRQVMTDVMAHVTGSPYLVTASKGVEEQSGLTMAGVLEQVVGARHRERICALSGPSFAREVAARIPTAVTVAARTYAVSAEVQRLFTAGYFRVYSSQDLVGVEIGGAVKNIIAIAAGVSDGLGFGANTRAALITRGLAETGRLALKMGADPLTLSGLSGLGDLVLTCTGDLSRNRSVGLRLGRGERLDAILTDMKMVAEGVKNTRSVRALAIKLGVEMPITEQMYAMLYESKPPRQVVTDLMGRELKAEFGAPGAIRQT